MGRIQNISPDARTVSDLAGRVVLSGQIVDVPDDLIINFCTQTDIWAAADDDTHTVLAEQTEQVEAAVAAETEQRDALIEHTIADEPKGNDGRAQWVDWVVGNGFASKEALDDLGRDEIRDQYQTYEIPEPDADEVDPDPVVPVGPDPVDTATDATTDPSTDTVQED